MRRKERQVTDMEQICGVINRCKVLRLGLNAPGAPYIVPMNFGCVLEGGSPVFYLHCAKEGRKVELLRANPFAGFETVSYTHLFNHRRRIRQQRRGHDRKRGVFAAADHNLPLEAASAPD